MLTKVTLFIRQSMHLQCLLNNSSLKFYLQFSPQKDGIHLSIYACSFMLVSFDCIKLPLFSEHVIFPYIYVRMIPTFIPCCYRSTRLWNHILSPNYLVPCGVLLYLWKFRRYSTPFSGRKSWPESRRVGLSRA